MGKVTVDVRAGVVIVEAGGQREVLNRLAIACGTGFDKAREEKP